MKYKKISEKDAVELFDSFLDEIDEIVICGLSYPRSKIFKAVDPVAYRCNLIDFIDGRELEIK